MYRFRIDYILTFKNVKRVLWIGIVANNFCDAERKAVKRIKYKYPSSGYNLYRISKIKNFKKAR